MREKRFLKAIGHGLAQVLLVASLLWGVAGSALANIPSDLNLGLPLTQVLSNALKAGMTWDEAVIALIEGGVDPRLVIQTALEMKADAYTVVAAAIRAGADPTTVIDAAMEASVDPNVIRNATLANDVPPEIVQKGLRGEIAPLEASMTSLPTTVQEGGKVDPSTLGSTLPPSRVSLKGPGGEERPPSASPFK